MVSILPSARTGFDVLGSELGKSLQGVVGPSFQQGFQRGQGLNAIDQMQKEIASAGNDPQKILGAIARAYTLNPNLERSGIAEQALMRAKGNVSTKPVMDVIDQIRNKSPLPSFGQGTPLDQAQSKPIGNSEKEEPKLSTSPHKPNQGIFISQSLPQDIGELITPEQSASIIQDVANRGGDVNFARQQIKDYNAGKISFNELANSNVEKQAANVQRMLGFEDQIKSRIDKYVPENTPEAEKNIYYNKVRESLENSTSFSDAWQKVASDIDNFRKLNEAYVKNIPEANIQGIPQDGERTLRNSAKPILDQDPLAYNVLEQAYINKGHSPITPAKILKPLPNNIKGVISKASDVKDLIYPMDFSTSEFPERMMQRNLDLADEKQDKDINKLAPELRKNWSEDISLMNIYADLKSKGWLTPKITTLLDEVQDLFNPRQQADRAQLNQQLRVPPKYLGLPWSEK